MAKTLSSSKNSDPQQQQQLLHITQHDKFYSRLLSKDTSLANPSFRVYYAGASGAVPFLWESQPGTPKKTVTAPALPPLTPPPSYHSNPKKKRAARTPPRRHSLIRCILPGRPRRSPNSASSSASHPSTLQLASPSSSSTSSSCSAGSQWIRYTPSPRSSFSSSRAAADEDSVDEGSPEAAAGCYSMLTLKKSLLHLVTGHGSG